MWQYFESFVHRNPLIRDNIFFLSFILGCRSSLLFKIQACEQRHRFPALTCRPLHQKRLGPEFMRLQSTHIRIQTFWDYLNNNQVILFQSHYRLPASLETNSQRTATCLVHAFFFKRDYALLHQSWRDLVVCRLITPPKMILRLWPKFWALSS